MSEAIVPLCRHLKANGHRCQSPALHGEQLCYFHNNLHHAHRRPLRTEALSSGWQESAIAGEGDPEGDLFTVARVYPRQDEIQFPPLEDPESIQLATSMLFQAVATGQIYFKRANLLIATLKIACINQRALARARAEESQATIVTPTYVLRTADGLALAPPDDPGPTPQEGVISPTAANSTSQEGVISTGAPPCPLSQESVISTGAQRSGETPAFPSGPPPHPQPSTAPTHNPNKAHILPATHTNKGFYEPTTDSRDFMDEKTKTNESADPSFALVPNASRSSEARPTL
ncbi:MAG TPA: hypothetical protein VGN01_12245 [Acidobacteriaceae bacterium]|jgi:hypothetical protein